MLYRFVMRRLTANLLLLLSLVGVFVPVTLAAYPSIEACCVRKCCKGRGPHKHESSGPSVQAAECGHQSCRCCLTVLQFADVAPSGIAGTSQPSSILFFGLSSLRRGNASQAAHAGRGPPQFPIA
jgi:hypothetical protein